MYASASSSCAAKPAALPVRVNAQIAASRIAVVRPRPASAAGARSGRLALRLLGRRRGRFPAVDQPDAEHDRRHHPAPRERSAR